MESIEEHRKRRMDKQKYGSIIGRKRHQLAGAKEKLKGFEKYCNGEEKHPERWRRILQFYKQPENRYKRSEPGSKGTLEYRKHALVFRCDI